MQYGERMKRPTIVPTVLLIGSMLLTFSSVQSAPWLTVIGICLTVALLPWYFAALAGNRDRR